jgi:hypothetical protein
MVFAGTLALSRDRWSAIAPGTAVVLSLTVFVGLAWLEVHHWGGHPRAGAPASTPAPRGNWTLPLHWQRQEVSQAMAQHADFRGADLNGATLAGLQLSHMDFDGVQANGASFRGSQLPYTS